MRGQPCSHRRTTINFYLPRAECRVPCASHLSDAYVHLSFVPKIIFVVRNNMEMCLFLFFFIFPTPKSKRPLFLSILPNFFPASVLFFFGAHSNAKCLAIEHRCSIIGAANFRCCILFSSCSTFSWYVCMSRRHRMHAAKPEERE